jgi:hypothetical protein
LCLESDNLIQSEGDLINGVSKYITNKADLIIPGLIVDIDSDMQRVTRHDHSPIGKSDTNINMSSDEVLLFMLLKVSKMWKLLVLTV